MKYHHAGEEVAPFPAAKEPQVGVWWCEDYECDCTHVEVVNNGRVVWTGTDVSADNGDQYAYASEITDAELRAARDFYGLKEE